MTQERVSRLEGAYEQVDRRLDDMNRSIQSVRDEMGSLRGEMNNRINNLYVLLGGTWVATMAAIIGLYFKS
jgi:tetrahydromethanopterin S-methyltransferase subunit G